MPKKKHYNDSDGLARAVHYMIPIDPILKNGPLDLTYVQSVLLNNDGDTDLYIDNVFRLKPGCSIVLGHSGTYDLVKGLHNISFDTGEGRLQIIEYHYDSNNC